jgi:hypothetical protein
MSIIGFTPWGVPIAGHPDMPGTMDPQHVSALLGGQLGMAGGMPVTLPDMRTVVIAGVDGTSVDLSRREVGQRSDRIRGNVAELFHQTSAESCRLIVEANAMKRGSSGIAGGGIYFATSLRETMHKAHHHGFVLCCRVKLGSVDRWLGTKIDSGVTFNSLLRHGRDSVFIPRPGGDEYIVYSSDQVQLLRVCRTGTNGTGQQQAGPWFDVAALRAGRP